MFRIYYFGASQICNYLYGSGPFHQQTKILGKTLISSVLWLLNTLLLASWKSLKKRAESGTLILVTGHFVCYCSNSLNQLLSFSQSSFVHICTTSGVRVGGGGGTLKSGLVGLVLLSFISIPSKGRWWFGPHRCWITRSGFHCTDCCYFTQNKAGFHSSAKKFSFIKVQPTYSSKYV